MKKSFMMMAMVAMVFASCKKDPTPSVTEVDPLDDGRLVAMSLTAGVPVVDVKASGMVGGVEDADNVWAGQTVNLWAVVRDATPATAIINGATAALNANDIAADAISGGPYYYNGTTVYDFYACHLDGAATGTLPALSAGKVVIPITITGGEDIMIAKANPVDDIVGTPVTNWQNAYSAYSARREVKPNLVFSHLLTRFTFKVVAGSDSATNVQVEGMKITGANNTANLTVVAAADLDRGLSAAAGSADFTLMQKGSAGLETLDVATFAAKGEEKILGESLMVIPGASSYKMILDLAPTAASGIASIDDYSIELTPTMAGVSAFEPGESYEIVFTIYGPEEIKVTTTLTKWVEHEGAYTYDPDEPPFQENN